MRLTSGAVGSLDGGSEPGRARSRVLKLARGALLAAVAALVATSAMAAGGMLTPASAHAQKPGKTRSAVAASGASPTVSLYAGNAGTESPGQSVTITISIDNASADVIGPGTATVSITEKPLGSRHGLDAWLKPDSDHDATTRVIQTATTQAVTAGTNQRVATLTIPEQAVGLSGNTAVYGLTAAVTVGSGAVGTGYSTLTYEGTGVQHQVGLAVAMPITVPPTSSGLIAADDLATYTAPDGLLTRQLQLARDHPSIAIAIDPMIIASIRVLGTSAPQSAQNWVNDLDSLTNDSFPLQYGDADVATQLQSGVTSLFAPTSFGYAMDPGNFPGQLTVGETPQPIPTPTDNNPFVTPTPTSTPKQPNVPSTAQLLSWPYTFSGIAWPADDSLRAGDLNALANDGYKSTIVSGSNTNQSSLSVTPNAPLPVKGGTALVTDQGVSDALRKVVSAIGADQENAALASVSAQLAEISKQGSTGTIILAGLDRSWPANEGEASRALTSVFTLPWVTASSLRDALTAPVSEGLKLDDAVQDPTTTAAVNQLTGAAGNMDAFATVLTDPTALTGQTRNELLSLLSVGWRQPDNNWPAAVAGFVKQSSDTVNSIKIDPTGKITVASAQSLIPVTVTNGLVLPNGVKPAVNVVLRATPSNNRLEVDSDTAKPIPADASAKVLVPVKAKLGNGSVKLGLQLYSPTGLPIGAPQTAAIEVHADWEGLGALALGIAVVLFFGFGLTRSILRRVNERRTRGSQEDAVPPAESHDIPPVEPVETDPAEIPPFEPHDIPPAEPHDIPPAESHALPPVEPVETDPAETPPAEPHALPPVEPVETDPAGTDPAETDAAEAPPDDEGSPRG
ncbi:DUF6049 family protein [Humibacter antri]